MTHLVPVGNGLGVQIPPHLLKAAHLDDASDLFFEVTNNGLFISPHQKKYQHQVSFVELMASCPVQVDLNIERTLHPHREVDFS